MNSAKKYLLNIASHAYRLRRYNVNKSNLLATYQVFSLQEAISSKNSNTLYILGSAPSLLDISTAQWSQIQENDSLALNNFCFFSHIPTYYWLELSQQISLSHLVFEQIQEAYKDNPPLFFLNYTNWISNEIEFDALPHCLRTNCRFFLPKALYSCKEESLKREFSNKLSESVIKHFAYDSLIHVTGSLVSAIQIGIALGYKKIILAGFDLKNQDYYFDFSPNPNKRIRDFTAVVSLRRRYSLQEGKVHRTVQSETAMNSEEPPVTTIVKIINELLMKKSQSRLYTIDRESLLAPILPSPY
jgi:hypothetical protein